MGEKKNSFPVVVRPLTFHELPRGREKRGEGREFDSNREEDSGFFLPCRGQPKAERVGDLFLGPTRKKRNLETKPLSSFFRARHHCVKRPGDDGFPPPRP